MLDKKLEKIEQRYIEIEKRLCDPDVISDREEFTKLSRERADMEESDALYFGDLNDPESKISQAMAEAEAADGELKQLRPEKGTRPRMWFAGIAPVEAEADVPREGESYGTGAYSIYNWKK